MSKQISSIPELLQDISEAEKQARKNYNSSSPAENWEASEKIKTLRNELAARLSAGANACPDCQSNPHGMIQNIAAGGSFMTLIEIGCLVCGPKEEPESVLYHRTRGWTVEQAVEAWNTGPIRWIRKAKPPVEQPKKGILGRIFK